MSSFEQMKTLVPQFAKQSVDGLNMSYLFGDKKTQFKAEIEAYLIQFLRDVKFLLNLCPTVLEKYFDQKSQIQQNHTPNL